MPCGLCFHVQTRLRLLFELHRLDEGDASSDNICGEHLTALYKSLGLWGTECTDERPGSKKVMNRIQSTQHNEKPCSTCALGRKHL